MRHPTHLFEKAFYKLGYQIGKHPLPIIFSVLLVSIVASVGLFQFQEVNNVRTEYSPVNAPSKKEYEVAKEFLKQNGTLDPCYIMTRAKDGGNLLRDEYRWLLYNLTRALQQEVKVFRNGRIYGYRDLCEPYCEMNTAFLAFLKIYDPAQPLTHTYPSVELFGTRAFIGNNVYAVGLKNITNGATTENTAADDANPNSVETTAEEQALLLALENEASKGHGKSTQENGGGLKLLESFGTAVMPFFLVADYSDKHVIELWQNAAIELFERLPYSRLLKTGMTSDYLVTKEVRRMGAETAPLLATSVVFMIIFVVCTSFRAKNEENRFFECLIGCLIPLLAMATAIGLMSACGYRFQSIIVAALFLVLSVGVDDIFILMRAWHRSSSQFQEHLIVSGTPFFSHVPQRMAICLEDAGPSITISSLTNVISFAIGAFSDTPAVRTFCIFSALAITICWLYQLVFLSAVVCLNEKRRERRAQKTNFHGFLNGNQTSSGKKNIYSTLAGCAEKLHRNVVHFWAWAVTKWITRITLAFFMCAYFMFCWLGIRKLQSNISIDKMALPNSYLHDFQAQFEMALRSMQPITIFVLRPGDMRDPRQLARVKQLVWDFEHAMNSYGPESTFFWLQQYEDFLRFYSNTNDDNGDDREIDPAEEFQSPRFTYTEIPAFFMSAAYFYLSSFVHFDEPQCRANRPECIQSFFFLTNFHRVIKYHELVPTVNEWRRIAAHYADMQVFAYSDHTPFVDQTIAIDQTVFGSVAAALICTCLVCMLFIPHFLSVIAAVFSVFSISWGIFGLLSLWNVDLDPLSMASLLMAIGFSVDFTAHISYHYYKAPEGNPRIRMEQALTVIGYPMVQVGLSTIVALLPLLFKQSYLAMVFLKTIIVVVVLGMFHGLILLPAVLTALPASAKPKARQCNNLDEFSSTNTGRDVNAKCMAWRTTATTTTVGAVQRQQRRGSGGSGKSSSNSSGSDSFPSSTSSDAGLGSSSSGSGTEAASNTGSSNLGAEDSASEGRQSGKRKQPEKARRLSIAVPMSMDDGTRRQQPPLAIDAVALVHRIALGRSASNAI